ncbi:two-component system sensor histidine kinase NtrB [Alkalilimnicola ehrlichii]|uniref:Sensory histidine kinase/phosphatase NtrB n=1 Tax=Alkalilimnicola ehrlichii TaxID=351052 RepID=A0A3E0WZG8_9GAMM|nr:nitrogen regulation protein NR(II) [Alkalilimnicola ehrlichii]RFA30665.1 two-component system sensor histidine kinase NtrB [Alkalilimnicola ehrlichii]RFA38244.1 two-component system sensor histidine kinase NtrB [Alkalilimnicola ehrlichii]
MPIQKLSNPTRLLEHMSTAVCCLDSELRIQYMNPAAEILFGVSARQLLGQPFPVLAPGAEELEAGIRDALANESAYTERERQLVLGANQTVTVDCSVTPLPDGDLLIELVQLDRHLRISREHNLLAQNRVVRELIRGLAHEVKNPLGGLRGAAQLLERELADQDLTEYTQIIIGEADRLQTLVDNMLGPNRRPNRRETNIHEVLERVRQLVEAEAPEGFRIVRDYDPSIPPLMAEPDQLIQACLNIVRNALQAVGGEGNITLRTRTQRRFTIGDTSYKLVARIEVIDNGPGIDTELQEQIFYPMVTTRAEGSGLGLPIAQTLVNQNGGLIECSSEPGETVFTIWLPLEESNARGA